MSQNHRKFYVTTPIYYVNDRPHIGHLYTTTVADVVARYHRLRGDDVFFLTGTDEHAAKVVDAAAERGISPQQWADRNAEEFQQAFTRFGASNDDFIRTSQSRHRERVVQYVQRLLESGDVYEGQYEGWYDAGQEEYIPENKAKEYDYKSPINHRPLVRKTEKNYFFRLSKFTETLQKHIEAHDEFIQPEARRNEVLARIREGLNDVPISRSGTGGWGITMPNDSHQTVYVWIDALFNYLTTVDTDERRAYWPADVHFIAKDILWFHAVIWPCMLMALNEPLPRQVYAHSFWIAEGQKMSKTLGNFIDLEKIEQYVDTFSLDALRYFLATQGPMGATDADFAHAKFVDVYNADLANTLGNCAARVTNMINRYFDGKLPAEGPRLKVSEKYAGGAQRRFEAYEQAMARLHLGQAAAAAMSLVSDIDSYIEETQPFRMAKEEGNLPKVGTVLYHCAEALRIASVMLWPVLPDKMSQLWQRLGCAGYAEAMNNGSGRLSDWVEWGLLQPDTPIRKGDPLFPRYQET
jgi:methionyl-tRNA synthetase